MSEPTNNAEVKPLGEILKELPEYGILHNEDCCVNFPEDSRACDVGTEPTDCCENMRIVDAMIRKAYLAGALAHKEATKVEKEQHAQVSEYYSGYNAALTEVSANSEEFLKGLREKSL